MARSSDSRFQVLALYRRLQRRNALSRWYRSGLWYLCRLNLAHWLAAAPQTSWSWPLCWTGPSLNPSLASQRWPNHCQCRFLRHPLRIRTRSFPVLYNSRRLNPTQQPSFRTALFMCARWLKFARLELHSWLVSLWRKPPFGIFRSQSPSPLRFQWKVWL